MHDQRKAVDPAAEELQDERAILVHVFSCGRAARRFTASVCWRTGDRAFSTRKLHRYPYLKNTPSSAKPAWRVGPPST